jgi:hypothetical protein
MTTPGSHTEVESISGACSDFIYRPALRICFLSFAGVFQHNKTILIADMIPPIIFLRRKEATQANSFIAQVAIAQARGFRNNFLFCHLLFSISVIDKSAVNSPLRLHFVSFRHQTLAGPATCILP